MGIDSEDDYQTLVMIIELHKPITRNVKDIITEIKTLCAEHPLLENVAQVLVHDSFPVDIRHNAKIFREKLAVWAQQQVRKR
ncbi:MAG: hypothetical protein P8X86_17055 [Desulfofustis sp.]